MTLLRKEKCKEEIDALVGELGSVGYFMELHINSTTATATATATIAAITRLSLRCVLEPK